MGGVIKSDNGQSDCSNVRYERY